MELLVAILAMLVGLAALFAGYRLFRELLPLFGFVVGFFAGAGFIADLLGEGFLQGVLGIVIGLALGLGFALIAHTWWWLGVIIAIGGFGFAIGFGVLPALGIDIAIVNYLVGLAVGMVLAIAAVVLRLPRAIVIVESALWGAAAVVAAFLVLIGQVDVEQLGTGTVEAATDASGLWWLVWLGLAIVGVAAQLATSRDYDLLSSEDAAIVTDTTAPPPAPTVSGGH